MLDRRDTTRRLTCLMDIEEWVHLENNVVKLYDKFNNLNVELPREDYILFRTDPTRFAMKNSLCMDDIVKSLPSKRLPWKKLPSKKLPPKKLPSKKLPSKKLLYKHGKLA